MFAMSEQDVKLCSMCGNEKPHTSEFFGVKRDRPDGLRLECRACRSAYRSRLRAKNLDVAKQREARNRKRNAASRSAYNKTRWAEDAEYRERMKRMNRAWHQENREEKIAYLRAWRANNPDRLSAQQKRAYQKNPLRWRVGTYLGMSLKDRGAERRSRGLRSLVGWHIADLRQHLERQFTRGMAWENYGTAWEIDHVIPLSAFSYSSSDDPEFKAAWALANLRPLAISANRSKGGKRTLLL